MTISIDLLKSSISKKGYSWYTDKPNLIGIRTTLSLPDVFNDIFCIVWTQPTMPSNLSTIDKQKFLASFLYTGTDGLIIKADGKWGKNSQNAMSLYENSVGKERIKFWTYTSEPGVYWLNHPMVKIGTSVVKPGQYKDCWSLGFHKGRSSHPALVQVGNISVYRDGDKDSKAEETSVIQTGIFGINLHRSNSTGKTQKIGQWSAGCQVFQVKSEHDQLLSICRQFKSKTNNKFTYTLIKESDL